MDELHDWFVSCAPADDCGGWVTGFLVAIQDKHACFTHTPLRVFLDRDEIRTMGQWSRRIIRALRLSKRMVAARSPEYRRNTYCRRE